MRGLDRVPVDTSRSAKGFRAVCEPPSLFVECFKKRKGDLDECLADENIVCHRWLGRRGRGRPRGDGRTPERRLGASRGTRLGDSKRARLPRYPLPAEHSSWYERRAEDLLAAQVERIEEAGGSRRRGTPPGRARGGRDTRFERGAGRRPHRNGQQGIGRASRGLSWVASPTASFTTRPGRSW